MDQGVNDYGQYVGNIAGTAFYFDMDGGHGPQRIAGEPGEDDTYVDATENWNADADFNGDNTVDLADYLIFKGRYGSSVPFE